MTEPVPAGTFFARRASPPLDLLAASSKFAQKMDVDGSDSDSDDKRPYARAGGSGSIGSASGVNLEDELRVGGFAMRSVTCPHPPVLPLSRAGINLTGGA